MYRIKLGKDGADTLLEEASPHIFDLLLTKPTKEIELQVFLTIKEQEYRIIAIPYLSTEIQTCPFIIT